jgi:hypothetical protein
MVLYIMKFILTWAKKIFVSIGRFILRYPLAAVLTIILVIVAITAACFGQTLQIGGLLEKLWGKKSIDPGIRVIPPSGRVDNNNMPIPAGKSDDNGYVQTATQLPIKDPGIFDNPDKIKIDHPTKGEITIPLPTGVKNKDVNQVIEIEPNVFQVGNRDTIINTTALLNDLEKKS